MNMLWKSNWEETRQRFLDWWDRKGIVLGFWGAPAPGGRPHADVPDPGPAASLEQYYTDASWRARQERYRIAHQGFPADCIPTAYTFIGPGSLGLLLGAEAGFAWDTVWYEPCITDRESHPPLVFDPESTWWAIHEAILRECVATSEGNYFVSYPDIIENFDTLAALRGNEELLLDLIDRPEWVKAKLWEINGAFCEAYDRMREIVAWQDGSSVFGAFELWGPGRVAKVQWDASAMLSPAMLTITGTRHLAHRGAFSLISAFTPMFSRFSPSV